MGKSGTQVAQQAADIVILDDKFSSIVKVGIGAAVCIEYAFRILAS